MRVGVPGWELWMRLIDGWMDGIDAIGVIDGMDVMCSKRWSWRWS